MIAEGMPNMRETGVVTDLSNGMASVVLTGGACCGHCSACADDGGGRMILRTAATEGIQVGQRVVVEYGPPHIAWGVILTFVLPMIGLVAGVILGQAYALAGLGRDLSAALYGFALAGALFGFAILADRLGRKRTWQAPHIVGARDQVSDDN
jgi:positive regulator of sigma E activity